LYDNFLEFPFYRKYFLPKLRIWQKKVPIWREISKNIFYNMNSNGKSIERKYLVFDKRAVMLLSENFSSTGGLMTDKKYIIRFGFGKF
jgi:hypothetical protein